MDNMCSCLEYIAHYTVKNFPNWIFSDIHFIGKYSTKARSGIDFDGMIRAIRTTFKGDNFQNRFAFEDEVKNSLQMLFERSSQVIV